MNKKGLTLVEILMVVAIILILSAVVFVVLNPPLRIKEGRDAARWEEINSVGNAVAAYALDHHASLPTGVSTDFQMLGTATSGCDMACGPQASTSTSAESIIDVQQADFDTGVYSDTQWDAGNNWVELDAVGLAAGSGTYTSEIMDANGQASWEEFSWLPAQPFYKQLPSNGATESGYFSGNASMTANVLYTRLNETGGSIGDNSGQGHIGIYTGNQYFQTGILKQALGFDGIDDIVSFADTATFDITGDITMEFWVYSGDWSTWPDVITKGDWNESYTADIDTAGIIRFGLNSNFLIGSTPLSLNNWHHVVCTRQGTTRNIYLDGNLDGTDTYGAYIGTTATPLTYSTEDYPIDGILDEAVVYDSFLSAGDARAHYRRGINRLKFQVRSCGDALCSGDVFAGPDGTGSTYYSEIDNNTETPPSYNLNGISDNQYFQYKGYFESDTNSYSPEVKQTQIDFITQTSVTNQTNAACLDLSGELVDEYITEIPKDPEFGSDAMTYYAVRREDDGKLYFAACQHEVEDNIFIYR